MSAGVSDDMRKAKWKAKRACDSAEQLGKQLRAGLAPAARAEAELDRILGEP